jgi:transcriptional regulator with XRE-family HTH domain
MTVSDRTGLLGLADLVRGVKHAIRDERVRQGLTQDEVAALMGSSQSTYAAWELDTKRGDTMISSLFRAAHVLGLDVEVRLVPRDPRR